MVVSSPAHRPASIRPVILDEDPASSTRPVNVKPGTINIYDDSPEAAAKRAGLTPERIERIKASTRAPRKYADADHTEVTPEYRVWKKARAFDADIASEGQLLTMGDGPANHAVYYPEAHDKDLGEGSWIFVIDPPHTIQSREFQVPLLSLWWARPHVLNSGRFGNRLPYQAVITTPAGDLHLWPHEYTLCREPAPLLGEEGVEIHSLGGDPVLDEDHLFYLRSRGISRHDATVMLFDQIKGGNFCYITFDEATVAMFAGVGTRWGSSVRADYAAGRVR